MGNLLNIYLVRHGETAWNREELFRGQTDIPLNARGRRQARAVARALGSALPYTVYSSPLKRAMATAAAIAGSARAVRILDGLTDMHFGQWEGLSVSRVKSRYPDQFQCWKDQPHKVRIPEGETLAAVRRRSVEALGSVIRKHAKGTIVLVAHRVINKLLMLEVLQLPNRRFWDIQQDNACINMIEYEHEQFRVRFLNDTCHVKQTGVLKKDF